MRGKSERVAQEIDMHDSTSGGTLRRVVAVACYEE